MVAVAEPLVVAVTCAGAIGGAIGGCDVRWSHWLWLWRAKEPLVVAVSVLAAISSAQDRSAVRCARYRTARHRTAGARHLTAGASWSQIPPTGPWEQVRRRGPKAA